MISKELSPGSRRPVANPSGDTVSICDTVPSEPSAIPFSTDVSRRSNGYMTGVPRHAQGRAAVSLSVKMSQNKRVVRWGERARGCHADLCASA